MEEPEWQDLVMGLKKRIPELVERFLQAFSERGLYDPELVSETDLKRTAELTMMMIIDRLGGASPRHVEVADSLGRRRARQGISMEVLQEAVRLDFTIIWQMLREIAGPGHADVLVGKVEWLLASIEGYISDVQQSFLEERALMPRDSTLSTERYLARLFNAEQVTPSLLEEVANGVRIDPASQFEILSVPGRSLERAQVIADAVAGERSVLTYGFRGTLTLFRVLGPGTSAWPTIFADVPSIYVPQVSGLGGVPEAARAALNLHRSAPKLSKCTNIIDLWPHGTYSHLEELLPGYFPQLLDALAELPPGEHERVTSTVLAYLETGSIKDTAEKLSCHRNTVINRFKMFATLTQLDVTVPREAALAYVLLAGRPSEDDKPTVHLLNPPVAPEVTLPL